MSSDSPLDLKFHAVLLLVSFLSATLSAIVTDKYYGEGSLQPRVNGSIIGVQDKSRYYSDYANGDCLGGRADRLATCAVLRLFTPLDFRVFSFAWDLMIFAVPSLLIYFLSKSRLASLAWQFTFICLLFANGGLYSQFLSTIPFLIVLFWKPKEIWQNVLLLAIATMFHLVGGALVLLLLACRSEAVQRKVDFFIVRDWLINLWKLALACAVIIYMLPHITHIDMLFPIPFGVQIIYANVGLWLLCWVYPVLYIARKAAMPRHKPELILIAAVLLASVAFAATRIEIDFWRVMLIVELATLYILSDTDMKQEWRAKEWLWLIAMQVIRIIAIFMLGTAMMASVVHQPIAV